MSIHIIGLNRVLSALETDELVRNVANTTEAYTRKAANEAAREAPVDSGMLRNSITASPEKIDDTRWQFGSNVEYARKQEYEHATKKAFIRKAVWNNEEPYYQKIKGYVRDLGG